jgi:hypothetical protein
MTSQSFKSPILAGKIIFLLGEAMNKSKMIKQTKKSLEVAAKLNFFKAPTQTILTNSSAQSLTIYDSPNFGKRFVNRSPGSSSVDNISNQSEYNIPSFKKIIDFVQSFYFIH